MQIEAVEIRGAGTSVPSVLQAALNLCKYAGARTKMEIRREQVSLEKVPVLVFRTGAESRFIQPLVPLAKFAANCGVPVFSAKRNIFQTIQPIGISRIVRQKAPVLVISEWLICRARRSVAGRRLCIQQRPPPETRYQDNPDREYHHANPTQTKRRPDRLRGNARYR